MNNQHLATIILTITLIMSIPITNGTYDEIETHTFFWKVSAIPYRTEGLIFPKYPNETLEHNYGDCDDKAVLFADYLYKKGEKDVKILILKNDNWCHAATLWDGRVYDCTILPGKYNITRTQYLEDRGATHYKIVTYKPTTECYIDIAYSTPYDWTKI